LNIIVVSDLENREESRKRQKVEDSSDSEGKNSEAEEDNPVDLPCNICGSTDHQNQPSKWVGCDTCDHWFHIECLPVRQRRAFTTAAKKKAIEKKKLICADCSSSAHEK
jgi:protein-arginine kinase activator protein McsA